MLEKHGFHLKMILMDCKKVQDYTVGISTLLTHYLKQNVQMIKLCPPSPHCFDPKMPISSFSCGFWPFCPNCPSTSRPQLGNPDEGNTGI